MHQADGFAENGLSVSVSSDPTSKTPLGFTARVSPAWGGDTMKRGVRGGIRQLGQPPFCQRDSMNNRAWP